MREEFRDITCSLRRQPRQDVFEIGVGVVIIELGRLDQAHDRGGALASQQRPRE